MTLPLAEADRLSTRIWQLLLPFCEEIQIAGSIRRRRPFVNDVDLVVLPRAGQLAALKARCLERCAPVVDGEQNFIVRLPSGVQLDVFVARPPQKDLLTETPTNFGSLFLCRTGSKEHNIWMVQHAKSMGLRWNPYHGVFDGYRLLASATEEDIFRALKLDFIEPERRER